jgi:hypothetical protein
VASYRRGCFYLIQSYTENTEFKGLGRLYPLALKG